ncbi:MAG: SIR2 family protein [Clostridia bacterium]
MNHSDILDKIEILRNKSETGKLVVFVGAGVSCNVKGMPNWSNLIQKMADSIKYSKCKGCKHEHKNCTNTCKFKNEYSNDEFLKIPQYVYNTDKKKYRQVLAENIKHTPVDAPISSAIFDLNPKHIITTNYDTLLESSQHDFASQYQVIIKDKDLLNSNKSKYIVKMHGDISDLDTIVLKESDYLNFSQNHVLIELFVKSLLVDHTVLFLGYSLNDYNVKLIINWLNHMRIQNKALNSNHKVGYIVLDEKQINKREIKYFANNQIDVVNINNVNMINDIPNVLSDNRGKKLYSFLCLISNPSLDNSIENINRSVLFLSQYNFVDYRNILKALYIQNCDLNMGTLILYNKDNYVLLKTFLSSGNVAASHLKRLFTNSGVYAISTNDFLRKDEFVISKPNDNELVNNTLYQFYLNNNYDLLSKALYSIPNLSNEKIFYSSFFGTLYKYDDVIANENNAVKLTKLFNRVMYERLTTYYLNPDKVTNFIKNIHSSRDRLIFKFYDDIFSGDKPHKLSMQVELTKLENSAGQILSHFNKIRNYAYTQYYLHFYNNLIFKGHSDLNNFMEFYIKAIVLMNRSVQSSTAFLGFQITTDRYSLEKLDIDIMTKFIKTKNLMELLDDYHIDKIDIQPENIDFLVNCFINAINSITKEDINGFRNDLFQTINNLTIILTKVNLDEAKIALLSDAISNYFTDEKIIKFFFSLNNYERRESLKAFEHLLSAVKVSSVDIDWLHKIISNESFWDYSVNVNFRLLRNFLGHLLPHNLNKDQQLEIDKILESINNFYHKIILLRLVYRSFNDSDIIAKYKTYITTNFEQLSTDALYDFVFSDWVDISTDQAQNFMLNILNLFHSERKDVHSFPDPLDEKLQCIYLFYLYDYITDISMLSELKNDKPHLQFLLDPETFDYSKVDFSNYMWVNFARYPKYMHYFIQNKQLLIPKIKEHLILDTATEDERKIMYGFFLDKDNIWE